MTAFFRSAVSVAFVLVATESQAADVSAFAALDDAGSDHTAAVDQAPDRDSSISARELCAKFADDPQALLVSVAQRSGLASAIALGLFLRGDERFLGVYRDQYPGPGTSNRDAWLSGQQVYVAAARLASRIRESVLHDPSGVVVGVNFSRTEMSPDQIRRPLVVHQGNLKSLFAHAIRLACLLLDVDELPVYQYVHLPAALRKVLKFGHRRNAKYDDDRFEQHSAARREAYTHVLIFVPELEVTDAGWKVREGVSLVQEVPQSVRIIGYSERLFEVGFVGRTGGAAPIEAIQGVRETVSPDKTMSPHEKGVRQFSHPSLEVWLGPFEPASTYLAHLARLGAQLCKNTSLESPRLLGPLPPNSFGDDDPSVGVLSGGRGTYAVRTNGLSLPELVYSNGALQREFFQDQGKRRGQPAGFQAVRYPTASGDSIDLLRQWFVPGRPLFIMELGWWRYSAMPYPDADSALVLTNPQSPQIVHDHSVHTGYSQGHTRADILPFRAIPWDVHFCIMGGGSVDLRTAALLESSGCKGVGESYGSYELNGVARGYRNRYAFKGSKFGAAHKAALEPFGPYPGVAILPELGNPNITALRVEQVSMVGRLLVQPYRASAGTSAQGCLGKWCRTSNIVEFDATYDRRRSMREFIAARAAGSATGEEDGMAGSGLVVHELPPFLSDPTFKFVDKVSQPFQNRRGQWIPAGRIELVLEGLDRHRTAPWLRSCAVFGGGMTNEVVALLFVHPVILAAHVVGDHSAWLLAKIRKAIKEHNAGLVARPRVADHRSVQSSWIHDHEVPTKVLLARSPWEYRPRAKIRDMLKMAYGRELNALVPGLVPGDLEEAVRRKLGEKSATELLAESHDILAGGGREPADFCRSGFPRTGRFGKESFLDISMHEPEVVQDCEAAGCSFLQVRATPFSRLQTFHHVVQAYVAVKVLRRNPCRLYPAEQVMLCNPLLMEHILGEPVVGGEITSVDVFLLDALFGCDLGARYMARNPDGFVRAFVGCAQYNPDGSLRNPEVAEEAWHWERPIEERVTFFEAIPWQLWDYRRPGIHQSSSDAPIAPEELAKAIEGADLTDALEVVPLLLPSFGTLQQLGQRVRARLQVAVRIAKLAPELFASDNMEAVYERVLRITYPEWFEIPEAGYANSDADGDEL